MKWVILIIAELLAITITQYHAMADDPLSGRVQVALALAAAAEFHSCWRCQPEDKGRELAKKFNRPLVLFVGRCGGKSKGLKDVVIASTVEYYGDMTSTIIDPTTPRVVVLAWDGTVWRVLGSLPQTASPSEIMAIAGKKRT